MKKQNLIFAVLGFLLISCVGNPPNAQYVYNTSPAYTWGYAEYFGPYYKTENKNLNNVISLSLFSDSAFLKINKIGNLVGTGQYLFLEDVFVPNTDVFLPPGTYTIDETGKPYTVAPGKNDTVDNHVFPIGAMISYFEENTALSTQKLITGGMFTVSRIGKRYNMIFNLKTADNKELKGSFTADSLVHFDQSLAFSAKSLRKRLVYTGK